MKKDNKTNSSSSVISEESKANARELAQKIYNLDGKLLVQR